MTRTPGIVTTILLGNVYSVLSDGTGEATNIQSGENSPNVSGLFTQLLWDRFIHSHFNVQDTIPQSIPPKSLGIQHAL